LPGKQEETIITVIKPNLKISWMERIDDNDIKSNGSRNILGVILILAGLLLISDFLGIFTFRFRSIIFSWQMVLIVLGIILVSRREGKLAGAIMLIVGFFFLLPRILFLPVATYHLFWPALLIIIGLVVLLNTPQQRKRFNISKTGMHGDELEDVNVFGKQDRIIESKNFRGGEIVNVFGGGDYNFLKSKLAPGRNVLEVVMIFGAMKIIVPADWIIKVDVTAVLGGFSDKRIISAESGMDPSKTLTIKGVAIFGGGELVSVTRQDPAPQL
jgi:predicted membrane protein